jgi:biofilm protein TabA
MIIDSLTNQSLYTPIHPLFSKAFSFLTHNCFTGQMPGKYTIDNSDAFALVSYYHAKSMSEGKLEFHRAYIDIQFIVQGIERIGYAHFSNKTASFDVSRDIGFTKGSPEFLTLLPGNFIILFPHDAHMPGINLTSSPSPVQKVVIKVPV